MVIMMNCKRNVSIEDVKSFMWTCAIHYLSHFLMYTCNMILTNIFPMEGTNLVSMKKLNKHLAKSFFCGSVYIPSSKYKVNGCASTCILRSIQWLNASKYMYHDNLKVWCWLLSVQCTAFIVQAFYIWVSKLWQWIWPGHLRSYKWLADGWTCWGRA